jgi:hypothetical protein
MMASLKLLRARIRRRFSIATEQEFYHTSSSGATVIDGGGPGGFS